MEDLENQDFELDGENLYAVEYSCQQKQWHVDNLKIILQKNLISCADGVPRNDYKILSIVTSLEAAHKMCEKLKSALEN